MLININPSSGTVALLDSIGLKKTFLVVLDRFPGNFNINNIFEPPTPQGGRGGEKFHLMFLKFVKSFF